jgi:hypothetical protein
MRSSVLTKSATGIALFLVLGASSCGSGGETPPNQCEPSMCHAGEQQKPWPDCECYGVGGPDDPNEPQTPDSPTPSGGLAPRN